MQYEINLEGASEQNDPETRLLASRIFWLRDQKVKK